MLGLLTSGVLLYNCVRALRDPPDKLGFCSIGAFFTAFFTVLMNPSTSPFVLAQCGVIFLWANPKSPARDSNALPLNVDPLSVFKTSGMQAQRTFSRLEESHFVL